MAMNRLEVVAFVLLASGLAPFTSADLGAAVWRSKHRKSQATLSSLSSEGGIVVVPLKRVGARRFINSTTAVDGHSHLEKTADGHSYVGSISIGTPPQFFNVVFDTSSGHILLPHRACKARACREHKRFSPWESRTSSDISFTGQNVMDKGKRFADKNVSRDGMRIEMTQADFGDGWAEAVAVKDRVCLGVSGGEQACTDVGIMAAVKQDDIPFRAMPQDGIVGLGMEGLTQAAFCSFFERLASSTKGMLPHFGILLREADGEIHFGSHARANICGPLHWLPVVNPEQGFWQIVVHAVRVGDQTVGDCGKGCRAIIDTGASRLGVLRSAMQPLQDALGKAKKMPGSGCQGPDLLFDLGGTSVNLGAKEYADRSTCAPHVGPVDLDDPTPVVYAFGEVVLRRYYIAFDWGSKRIGFAQIECDSSAGPSEVTAPMTQQTSELTV